ncbi:glycosyltransferase family 4 protein [Vicingaceae bacterium]|nr:glycosyltransferase family 4 protein [Vicingaceae bacterium]
MSIEIISTMHKITYFQRKRRKVANFSLEQVFEDLIGRVKNKYEIQQKGMPYVSSGFFRRLMNVIDSVFYQGDVNHITGDINYVALLLKKRKTISTILDLGILDRTSGIKRRILLDIWFKWPVKRSKWVTVISEATKQDLLKNVKCNSDKIKVVYVPISEGFKRVNKEFDRNCPTILQIGAASHKNLKGLIIAVKGISCKLLIIGRISESNLTLLNEYDIQFENKVGLPFEDVIHSYVSSDILFFASTFEGFGMPIIEAQTIGRPVITSNLLSMPEVGGDACVYVDPLNIMEIKVAISKIINEDGMRKELIDKGFENVKRFKGDKIAAQYEELYRDILENQ